VHATDELVIVLEGRMEFEIEGAVHHPDPGGGTVYPRWRRPLRTQYWRDDRPLAVWLRRIVLNPVVILL